MLKQKVPKTEKRLDALADTSKNRHQKNALKCVSPNLFEPNTSDIDPNFSPAVKMFKSRGQPAKVKEKENSFNKHSSVELSFLRVEQVFKDLPKKPLTKNLKQQKISFGKANGSSTSDNVKAISKVEIEDSDATFCEEIERKKATKRPAWQPKIIIKELKKSTPSVEKKSRITEKVNDGLFNFTLPPTPVLRSISTTQLPNEQKASPKVAIKQEPFTCGSDPDIFSASEDEPSNGSSVIYVEASERNKEPIIIPDRTVHSDDYINEELEKEFAQRTEYDDPSELIETKPARKRARKYGECTNCREVRKNIFTFVFCLKLIYIFHSSFMISMLSSMDLPKLTTLLSINVHSAAGATKFVARTLKRHRFRRTVHHQRTERHQKVFGTFHRR